MLSFVTVNIVPPIASEFFLIENSAVGAQERRTLMAFATIVADMVGLATCLYVCIHAGNSWYIAAMEISLRNLVIDGVIVAGYSWNFIQILSFLLVNIFILGIRIVVEWAVRLWEETGIRN